MSAERMAREFDSSYERSQQAADDRPWAHPARLPDHPVTHSDRHPDEPRENEVFTEYF